MWHWHGDGAGMGWGAGDWVSTLLMMLLVWGPILLVAFFLVRALLRPRDEAQPNHDPAEEEARRAYARGEIDREHFHQVIADLRDHSPQAR